MFIQADHWAAYPSANLVRWLTENNRPTNIINDRALRDLLLAGRPSIDLPSRFTISRDIRLSFLKCQDRISKLLQVSSDAQLTSTGLM